MSFHKQQKLPYLHLDRSWGLPSGQIHKLAVTSLGDVWMATPAGLSHYDGTRIETYTQKHGLSTHGLRTVYCLEDDQLLIGTDISLDQQIPGTTNFEPLISASEWKFGFIECLLKNENGTFWLGTAQGLYLYTPSSGDVKATTRLFIQGYINKIHLAPDGNIWVIGKPFGLTQLDTNRDSSEVIPNNYNLKGIETICFNPANPDQVLVGGRFGVSIISQKENSVRELIPAIPENPVTCLYSFGDEIWFGTKSGLSVFYLPTEDNAYVQPDLKLLLPDHQISDIQADAIGNVWVASNKNGAFKFSFMRSFCVEYEHPELESVFSIREKRDSVHAEQDYLLTCKSGVFLFNKILGLKRYPPLAGLKEHVWDLHQNIDGQIWIAAESGLYLYDKLERIRKIGSDHPVCRSPNRCLLEAEDGNVYLGTQSGLALIRSSAMISEIKDNTFNSLGYVYALESAPNSFFYVGTIGNGAWYGSILGLQRLRSRYIDVFDSVYSICRHTNGSVAFLCNNKIIIRSEEGEERLLVETDRSIAGWSVKWESDERIWVGTSYGLFEIDVSSGEVLRNLKSLPGSSLWEFNFSESLFIGKNGKLLCGLRGNFTVVDAKKIRSVRDKPELKLKSYEWINASGLLISDQHINEGKWSLSLQLYCNWTLDEENLKFRYRLSGFDVSWSELGSIREIRYNSLPNGNYSLMVQAYSPLFGWGDSSEIFKFQVSINSRFGGVLNRLFLPLFTITDAIKSSWRNLSLQKTEKRVSELVRTNVSVAEQDNRELAREKLELEKTSNIDELTGVGNRRAFDIFLDNAIEQASRHKLELSLILLDIDYFKGYNDTYGHIAGDDVLKQFAGIVAGVMRRGGDFLARYGGEEFALVLPMTNTEDAQSLAKRINQAIWSAKIEHIGQPHLKRLTSSMGVVSVNFANLTDISARDIIHQTDQNLYRAKDSGKNRYIASEYSS